MNVVSRADLTVPVARAQDEIRTPPPTLLQRIRGASEQNVSESMPPASTSTSNDDETAPPGDTAADDVESVFREAWIRNLWIEWLDTGKARYEEIGGS